MFSSCFRFLPAPGGPTSTTKDTFHGLSKSRLLPRSCAAFDVTYVRYPSIVLVNPTGDRLHHPTHFIVRRSQQVTLHDAAVATSTGRCGSHAAAGAARAAAAGPGPPWQTLAEPASSNLKCSAICRSDIKQPRIDAELRPSTIVEGSQQILPTLLVASRKGSARMRVDRQGHAGAAFIDFHVGLISGRACLQQRPGRRDLAVKVGPFVLIDFR